nr:helix-turn-helix domain-containing protein [Cohnella fermenti]
MVSDIQRILGIGRRGAYELIQNAPFPVQRVGARGLIRVSRDAFFRWLESSK